MGDYSEGKLFLEDARGNSSLKLKNDVGKLKKGTVVRGFDVDIKGGWPLACEPCRCPTPKARI